MDIGAVTAGVVGGRRPQFDIWGQCVTLASRLEVTSLPDHLQVKLPMKDVVYFVFVVFLAYFSILNNDNMI